MSDVILFNMIALFTISKHSELEILSLDPLTNLFVSTSDKKLS